MGRAGIMDPVPLQVISRYLWVKNNDTDPTLSQTIDDCRNICRRLLLRREETEVGRNWLQDDDIGFVGGSAPIDPPEHAGGSFPGDPGTSDHSIDTAFLEDGRESGREGLLCTNAPARCI